MRSLRAQIAVFRRQRGIIASPVYGSVADVVVRPRDVLGRTVVVEPLAHIQLTIAARPRHRGHHDISKLLLAAQVSELGSLAP